MDKRDLVAVLVATVTAILLLLVSSCTSRPRYTSLDIDLMPCERGVNTPKFFKAIEFDKNGNYKYPDQLLEITRRLEGHEAPITDLIVFTHGWNKSPESAELDYQNFICRLHSELDQVIGDQKRRNGLLIVGVFWPSTITNRPVEPYLLKPISYYNIRSRADSIAEKGMASFLAKIGKSIREKNGIARADDSASPRIHLIGHSFGGRMVIRAMETLNNNNSISEAGTLVDFLTTAKYLNVVLLNAAMPAERFEWIAEAMSEARRLQGYSEFETLTRFTENTQSYLFNVHSLNDTPNRILFRIASVFNSDSVGCAVGACGIPSYDSLCISESGKIFAVESAKNIDNNNINGIYVWNANSENIVFSHSDIYKGRIAKVITDLIYNEKLRKDISTPIGASLPRVKSCREPESIIN